MCGELATVLELYGSLLHLISWRIDWRAEKANQQTLFEL
jgi:hypothetical protein